MRDDPIVEEIRQARREHALRFQNDLHAICEDLRRQERESGREFVSPAAARSEAKTISDPAAERQ